MNQMKFAVPIIGLLAIFGLASTFDIATHTDFDSAIVKSVSISACPEAEGENCIIKLGTNVTFNVDFETTKSFKRAILQVGSREGDEYTDFSFSLACSYLGLICPSEVGQHQTLTLVSEINNRHPMHSTHYRLSLYDELKNTIFSIRFPVKIVDS